MKVRRVRLKPPLLVVAPLPLVLRLARGFGKVAVQPFYFVRLFLWLLLLPPRIQRALAVVTLRLRLPVRVVLVRRFQHVV